ncbi:MAG: hypothetical protein IJS07_04200 [Bacteroidales bacterium]|nr:hypothetical protein [Bacteroidales bacterium]
MKNILRLIVFLAAIPALVSCYEDYVEDYEYPSMGFALPRQIRTVVTTDNLMHIGVSIGGKREVDLNDWGAFTLDETLLAGTPYKMMPEYYFTLDDPSLFRPRKTNLPVADVGVVFTDDFFNDPLSLTAYYALPFRLVGTSIPAPKDSTGYVSPYGAIMSEKETAIVVIKYISGYSGVYYRYGRETEYDSTGAATGVENVYENVDLPLNGTLSLLTQSRDVVRRPGLGNGTDGGLDLDIRKDDSGFTVTATGVDGGPAVTVTSCTYKEKGDYFLYGGKTPAPQFELEYSYVKAGMTYSVREKLIVRQPAQYDLRVETF